MTEVSQISEEALALLKGSREGAARVIAEGEPVVQAFLEGNALLDALLPIHTAPVEVEEVFEAHAVVDIPFDFLSHPMARELPVLALDRAKAQLQMTIGAFLVNQIKDAPSIEISHVEVLYGTGHTLAIMGAMAFHTLRKCTPSHIPIPLGDTRAVVTRLAPQEDQVYLTNALGRANLTVSSQIKTFGCNGGYLTFQMSAKLEIQWDLESARPAQWNIPKMLGGLEQMDFP